MWILHDLEQSGLPFTKIRFESSKHFSYQEVAEEAVLWIWDEQPQKSKSNATSKSNSTDNLTIRMKQGKQVELEEAKSY